MSSLWAPTPGGRWARPRCPVEESLARHLWLTYKKKGQAGPRGRPKPFSSVLTARRDCPKRVGGACGVTLRSTSTVLFDPFWPPCASQIHAHSVALTPFRTVSKAKFAEFLVHALR